jgi:glycine/D-amino acid oxidase-like deaminating enzyme
MPELERFPVNESWAGLRPFAADGLPVIGRLPGYENAFVATAHYRNGILLAPLTAKIVAEKIVDGNTSNFFNSFPADRFTSAANATWI